MKINCIIFGVVAGMLYLCTYKVLRDPFMIMTKRLLLSLLLTVFISMLGLNAYAHDVAVKNAASLSVTSMQLMYI